MRKLYLTAALVAAALPLSPALARTMSGYTVRPSEILAGPEEDYPAVGALGPDVSLVVYGCLSDWSWCDVSYGYDRGWIAGDDIAIDYQGRRSALSPYMGIGVLSFVFGTYWGEHYQGRPFYADRSRWQQSYTQHYRPEWGGHQPGRAAPNQRQPDARQPFRGQNQPYPAQHLAPTRQTAPHAIAQPSQRQPGAWQHQGGQRPQQAAPRMQAAPNRPAAPMANRPAPARPAEQPHASGPQSRPQGGGEQGHQGPGDAERKPRG